MSNKNVLGNDSPLIDPELFSIISQNYETIESAIDPSRDFLIDFFGFKTLERAYLMKVNGKIVETPQYMFMRVALGIHYDIPAAIETYNFMSQKYFIHATPTLFNAGTPTPQMSSCYLTGTEDSISGIYKTITDCAKISKYAGGIGVHISNIRSKNAYIAGTNGNSSGIIPMLKVYNETACYVNQAGKRNGSFAVYLEPWHADIFEFLELRKNHGNEKDRARDLFYALWIPDLFMEQVEKDEDWYLMCPNESPNLESVYGRDFRKMYNSYIIQGKYRKKIKARELWSKIIELQIETGMPYMCYKDSVNFKNNQKNIGTIRSSNLCTEINEYSDSKKTAVCNLASIALPSFLDSENNIDHSLLGKVTRKIVQNLNIIIDRNFYPTEETRRSNFSERPIGIGVQGLSDLFIKKKFPFDSKEAKDLNLEIFETIYYHALDESCELAQKTSPYETFQGSPAHKGILQFDLWNSYTSEQFTPKNYPWDSLKEKIISHGLRNSLLLAPMPTASTSQILGFTECFEPLKSNIYKRRTLAGEFTVLNRYLVDDLMRLGLWTKEVKNKIIEDNGSVQNIPEIPQDIKSLYKTVWEISQKAIIDLAADRGRFVCQSQSMNIYMSRATYSRLTSMHFYGWKKGLKTGSYYIHSKPSTDAIKITVEECLNCGS